LEANDGNYKKEKLYDESIDLHKKKKKFILLISLFLKIYEYNKDLCIKLIKIFKEINDKENTDRDKELSIYVDAFNQIYSNADDIIKDNGYDSIKFLTFLYSHIYICIINIFILFFSFINFLILKIYLNRKHQKKKLLYFHIILYLVFEIFKSPIAFSFSLSGWRDSTLSCF